jgi:hypothetical protein
MSRFARMQSGPSRVWAPPESPLRIEFSSALVREVRMAGTMVDAFGVLYGVRHGNTVNLVSTRGRAGLDAVGIFASRVRGEVFLTEEDLERFEKAEASLALVIAGETCGFFVRDAEGSIETVRSYSEFSIHEMPTAPVAAAVPRAEPKRRFHWAYALALLPLLYFAVPRGGQAPLAVTLNEDAGTLKIAWNRPKNDTLMILDGGELTTIAVQSGQSQISYGRRTGDVVVKLGSAQTRFVGPPPPSNELQRMRASIENLQVKIADLRQAKVANAARIAALQRRLQ